MNGKSLKKSLIISLSNLPGIEGLEKNSLILTTAIGNICGKLITDEQANDKTNPSALIAQICKLTRDDYLEENTDVIGNDGYLILTDVKIKSVFNNSVTTLPIMVVFYDQIIGVSIGNVD